jgi:hypothetical protein
MVLTKFRLVLVILIAFVAISVGIVSADIRVDPASLEQGLFTEFRLTPTDAVTEYGRSVAIDGNFVAVGAGGDGAVGAVYLYKRQGMINVLVAKLVSPDAAVGEKPEFGRTVAIKGNKVIVGARFAGADGVERAGAVYVFGKHGDSWQFEEKIISPLPETEDNFGRALAIQGDRLVVTARKTSAEEGAAYVFVYTGGRWIHQATLVASDPTKEAYFGQSVDIQGDVIAIGARNANPNKAGGFYLFRKFSDGWREIAKVTPSNGEKNDQFGFAIATSGDIITVGARRADSGDLTDAGAAYVYSLKGDSVELVTKLTASDASEFDEFGQSVANAGDVIAVGAWKDDNKQGSIYLFHRMGDKWIETDKITASDGVAEDEFGYSLSAFGNRMVTGAHFADSDVGAAYVISIK